MTDDTPLRLISLAEVRMRVGLGKTTIYTRVAAGTFPKPVSLGTTSRWVDSEVTAWIAAQIATRDGVDRAA